MDAALFCKGKCQVFYTPDAGASVVISTAKGIGHRLKAINSRVRTVVSSGDRFDPTMLDPVAAGFYACLIKPYTRDELKECIRSVLGM